jgi:hypothetical protein
MFESASGPSLAVRFDVSGPVSLILTTRESPNSEGSDGKKTAQQEDGTSILK